MSRDLTITEAYLKIKSVFRECKKFNWRILIFLSKHFLLFNLSYLILFVFLLLRMFWRFFLFFQRRLLWIIILLNCLYLKFSCFVWYKVISSFLESFFMKSWIISSISSILFNLLNHFIGVLMLFDLNIFDIFPLYCMYSFTSFPYSFNLNLFLSFSNLSFFIGFYF